MKEDCVIAAVQMTPVVGDIDANVNIIIESVRATVKQGAQFIVFPEMALQGYTCTDADSLAIEINDPAIEILSRIAFELHVTLLVGFAERSIDATKPYISQLVALPDGDVQVYRKIHLGCMEKEYFSPGREFPVFSSHGARFAVGICWDWHFPELAAIYSLKGAEILFAPHASPGISGDRQEIWQRYMQARAYDNSVYIAACNICGTDSLGREYSGGAVIWGPKGEILNESSEKTGSIIYGLLSAQKLNNLRTRERKSMKDSFFLTYRRKELYKELLELEIK
jgi:Predicted amidohydrolase